MKKEKVYHALENLRGSMTKDDYIQVIAIGCLVFHVSGDERYQRKIDVQKIMRSEEDAKYVLLETLTTIKEEIPMFEEGFEMFTALEHLESSQVTRLFYQLHELKKEVALQVLLESALFKLDDRMITSQSISDLVAEILQPKGTLYDGTIGYAGGAISLFEYAEQNNENLKVYGQEMNSVVAAVAKIRLFITGAEDSMVGQGDVFIHPKFATGDQLNKFDYVYMAPPIGMKINYYDDLTADKYNQFFYGMPSRTNSDYAFVSHALTSLNEHGKAIVLLADGSLFRGGAEERIRKNIIAADLIETVISLPSGFLRGSNIPINLILFNKNKDATMKDNIQFIKVTDAVEDRRYTKSLTKDMIEKIRNTIHEQREEKGFSIILPHEELEESILLTSRYVLSPTMHIEGIGEVSFDLDELDKMNTVALKDYATFYRGFNVGSKNKETSEGQYQIIRLSDVQDGRILIDQIPHYNIENNARVDLYRTNKGDVIVSIRGGVIKAAVIEEDVDNLLLSQNFMGIRCKGKLNPYIVKTFIESPVGQYILTSKLSGTAIQTLNRKDLESLEIPLLPIEEQNVISNEFQTREREIEMEVQQLEQELKDARIELYKNMGLNKIFTV